MIKNIVFDFGGVLVDWNQRYFYRDYFHDDASMEYFLANVCTNEWNRENDRGRTYAEGTASLKAVFPEWSEAIDMFPLHWGDMLRGDKKESVHLVERLKKLGYKLYGLTNWSAENIHVAYERFSFPHIMDGVVVSGIEKEVKPEPPIYHILLRRYGLRAEETVFIDDNEENIAAAEAIGFHGIVFTSAEDTAAKLAPMLGISVADLLDADTVQQLMQPRTQHKGDCDKAQSDADESHNKPLKDSWRQRGGEVVRFGIVGVAATLLQYAIYWVLIHWLGASLSMTIGYVISFVFNFFATTRFTFRVRANARRGAGFVVSHAVNCALQIVMLNLFLWLGVSKQLAPIPMFCICVPVNFLLVRYVMKR